jgi:hypothetical protein
VRRSEYMTIFRKVKIMWELLGGEQHHPRYFVPFNSEIFCLRRLNMMEERLEALEAKKSKKKL